jgi:beta-lactamase class D
MKRNLTKIEYPGTVIYESNLDIFWIDGVSRISPNEQIDFINKIVNRKLPISENTYELLEEFMLLDSKESHQLYVKTGWTFHEEKTQNNGWFVDYLKTDTNLFLFATNLSPNENFEMSEFPAVRKKITLEAFKLLEII